MSKLTQLGQNNPLWRRVQRHAQMSTIFAPRVTTAVSFPPPFALAQPKTPAELESWDVEATAVSSSQSPSQTDPPTLQRMANPVTAVSTPQPVQPAKPAVSETTEDNTNWRRLQTIMQRHRQKQTAEESSTANPESPEPIQRTVSEEIRPAQIETATPSEIQAAASRVPQDENPSPAVQSVPLDAAWPVQKKSDDTPPSTPPSSVQNIVQRAPLPEKEATQINQNLAQVAPGRQTQSPIETIMPSRPRPQPKATEPVQREPVEKNVDTGSKPSAGEEEMDTAVLTPPTSPRLIQTEIGPLPADLWETLGEKPPETPMTDKPAAAPSATQAARPNLPIESEPLGKPQPDKSSAPKFKQKDVVATAVTPLPSSTINSLMVKPITPKGKVQQSGVHPASTTTAKPLPPMVQTTPVNAPIQPTGETDTKIQRQAAETAVFTPPPGSPPNPNNEEAVNIIKQSGSDSTPLSKGSHRQAIQVAAFPTLTNPVSKSVVSPTNIVQAKPIRPSAAVAEHRPDTAVPIQQIRPTSAISPVPAATIQRETAVLPKATQPKPTNTLTTERAKQVPTETVIQRLPDLPAALEIAAEATSPTLAEIIPEADTAVPDNTTPLENEAEETNLDTLDIDALARQVYQQLKRKLAVEWERSYGR